MGTALENDVNGTFYIDTSGEAMLSVCMVWKRDAGIAGVRIAAILVDPNSFVPFKLGGALTPLKRNIFYTDKSKSSTNVQSYWKIESTKVDFPLANVMSLPVRCEMLDTFLLLETSAGETTIFRKNFFQEFPIQPLALQPPSSIPAVFQEVLGKLRERLFNIPRLDEFVEPFLQEPGFDEPQDTPRQQRSPEKPKISASFFLKSFQTDDPTGSFSLIASQAGSGKTRLLRYFQHTLLRDEKNPRVVIWLDNAILAGKFKVETDITPEALRSAIITHIGAICNDTSETFTQGVLGLLTSGKAVVIIDGLDELVMANAKESVVNAWINTLTGIVSFLGVKCVIASCRQTMLGSGIDYQRFQRFGSVYEIVPWDKYLMRAWLDSNMIIVNPEIQDDVSKVLKKIVEIQPLEEICKVPFLLKSFVEIYHEVQPESNEIQKYEIYERLIRAKLKKQVETMPLEPSFSVTLKKKLLQIVALHYLAGMAGCMDLDRIDFLEAGASILNENEREKVQKMRDQGLLANLIRNSTMLEVASEGCIFPHRSIAEYLVADLIAKNHAAREEYFFATYFTPEAIDFLIQMLGKTESLAVEEIVRFFSEPCQRSTGNRLLRWMEKELKNNFYSMQDIGRVVTKGFTNQVDIDCSEIHILQRLFDFTSLDGETHEMTTLLDLILRNDHIKTLYLNNCKLSSLPETIGNLKVLIELNLGFNQLTSLPDTIGELKVLEKLDIGNNQISSLPGTLGQLTSLQQLWLNSNRLSFLPEIITQMTWLKGLYLGGNQLTSLPETIGQLISLKRLYLQFNELSSLPEKIGELNSLEYLDLRNNIISFLPETIEQLTALQILKLSDNIISFLPDTLGQLTSLQQLWLYNNELSSLPETIWQLSSLQYLYLGGNQLSSLPESLCQLKSLQTLVVNGNQLISFPDSIGELKSLKILNLQSNQLSSLPVTLGNLASLEVLALGGNQLLSLPETIEQLGSLKELNLGNNQLTSIPETIGQLKSLQQLWLYRNQLSSLPETIGNLKVLIELNLGFNQLTSLPDTIGELKALENLDIESNQLTSIPETLGQLTLLKQLLLDSNRLSFLPETLGQLKMLQNLLLNSNRLSSLPEIITQMTWLTGLHLGRNQLTTLPETIGQLTSLDVLELSNNQLSSLPDTIGELKSLFRLHLDTNNLTFLPDTIGELKSLFNLDLGRNHLSTLPRTIGQLISLNRLDLSYNNLSSLPASIGELKSLRYLNLSHNNISSLPRMIKNWIEILKKKRCKVLR